MLDGSITFNSSTSQCTQPLHLSTGGPVTFGSADGVGASFFFVRFDGCGRDGPVAPANAAVFPVAAVVSPWLVGPIRACLFWSSVVNATDPLALGAADTAAVLFFASTTAVFRDLWMASCCTGVIRDGWVGTLASVNADFSFISRSAVRRDPGTTACAAFAAVASAEHPVLGGGNAKGSVAYGLILVVTATTDLVTGMAWGIAACGGVLSCGWVAMAATTVCGIAESLGSDTSFCKPTWSHRCQFGSCE